MKKYDNVRITWKGLKRFGSEGIITEIDKEFVEIYIIGSVENGSNYIVLSKKDVEVITIGELPRY